MVLATSVTPISVSEQNRFVELENKLICALEKVETKLCESEDAAIEARHLALQMHDSKLYQTKYGTWDRYCADKLNLPKRRSWKLLNRARLERLLSNPEQKVPPEHLFLKDLSELGEIVTLSAKQAESLEAFSLEVQVKAYNKAKSESDNPGPALLKKAAREIEISSLNKSGERESNSKDRHKEERDYTRLSLPERMRKHFTLWLNDLALMRESNKYSEECLLELDTLINTKILELLSKLN